MRTKRIIHIRGMEFIDLLRELRKCDYKDKGKHCDFTLIFYDPYAAAGGSRYKYNSPSDDILLTIYNSNMFNDVRIKRLLLEYLI